MTKALFICARNRLRSPTAEHVFAAWPGVETDSAGLARDADVRLSPDQLAWADIVFVMERAHGRKLRRDHRKHLKHQRVICLEIPDDYDYMDADLVELLEIRAGPHLE